MFVNLRASILVCNPSVLYKLNSLGPDCCIECAIASCSHADPRVFILLLSDWSKMSPASLSLASTPQTEQISKKKYKEATVQRATKSCWRLLDVSHIDSNYKTIIIVTLKNSWAHKHRNNTRQCPNNWILSYETKIFMDVFALDFDRKYPHQIFQYYYYSYIANFNVNCQFY